MLTSKVLQYINNQNVSVPLLIKFLHLLQAVCPDSSNHLNTVSEMYCSYTDAFASTPILLKPVTSFTE